ncbi:MAG TPA: hypothetical protein VFS19_02330, partial [Planctomycetota bacterium]|nr:hypothetical protein [Planctomycetota bacterium]
WAKGVGAFWRRVTFVETSRAGGRFWAVELRPGPDETEGKDLVQRHDLRTGEIFASADEEPAGARFKPIKIWSGAQSRVPRRFVALISTPENWDQLRGRMFDEPEFGKDHKPDFSKELVLVVSDGETWNCRRIGVNSAYRDDKRILIRLSHHTFQSGRDGERLRPWGIFVLPRKDGEIIHLERNVQRYIGGPPIWKDAGKLERAKDPAKELDSVPEPDPLKKD